MDTTQEKKDTSTPPADNLVGIKKELERKLKAFEERQEAKEDVEKVERRQSVLRPEQGKIQQTEQESILNVKKPPQASPTSDVLVEFNRWKKTLINMIKQKSSLQYFNETNYQFVLPPPLVKLVWDVTIKERIAAQELGIPETDRIKRAYEGIRADLERASKERQAYAQLNKEALQKRQEAPQTSTPNQTTPHAKKETPA